MKGMAYTVKDLAIEVNIKKDPAIIDRYEKILQGSIDFLVLDIYSFFSLSLT